MLLLHQQVALAEIPIDCAHILPEAAWNLTRMADHHAQGPRFDLEPEIQRHLQRVQEEQGELLARGVPPMDMLFLLLAIPDSSHTPSAVWWCYSLAELTRTYTLRRWAAGWHQVYVLDGRDEQRIQQVVDVHTIGKVGFHAHRRLPQLRATLQRWLTTCSNRVQVAAE